MIRILYPSRIPNPGVKKAPTPGSAHWYRYRYMLSRKVEREYLYNLATLGGKTLSEQYSLEHTPPLKESKRITAPIPHPPWILPSMAKATWAHTTSNGRKASG
jgi:hypothetical protein